MQNSLYTTKMNNKKQNFKYIQAIVQILQLVQMQEFYPMF